MKKAIDATTESVTFTFDDGLAPLTLTMKDVSTTNKAYAMLHGFAQRCGDNAAIARKQKDGTIITVTEAMRHAAVAEMVNHYASGSADWETKRSAPQNPVILQIAEKLGVSYAEAEAKVQEKLLAELASLS